MSTNTTLYDWHPVTVGQVKRMLAMLADEQKVGMTGADQLLASGHLSLLLDAANNGLLTTMPPVSLCTLPAKRIDRNPISASQAMELLDLVISKEIGASGINDLIATGHLASLFRLAASGMLTDFPLPAFRPPIQEIPEEVFLTVDYGLTLAEMFHRCFLDPDDLSRGAFFIGGGEGVVTRRVKLVRYRHGGTNECWGERKIKEDFIGRRLEIPGLEWLLAFIAAFPEVCKRFQVDVYALGATERSPETPPGCVAYQDYDPNFRRRLKMNWRGNICSSGGKIFLGLVKD